MTTLAADAARTIGLGDYNALPVIATDVIYEGAAVGDNGSGYARPLVSGDPFRGFARAKADNAAGAAGDVNVEVLRRGLIQLAVSGLAITDVGRPVFASDDDTFSLAGAGSYVGRVARWVSSGVGIVAFDADVPEPTRQFFLPVTLAAVSAADVLTSFTPGFDGRVKKVEFAVTEPVTTASDAATLNLEIGTTDVTGGAVALTSANATPLGKIIAGTAVTALNAFKATDTISVEASSVTAFAEGAGVLIITCTG